jgi:AAA+ superfamily predicted ATPase
MHAYERWIIRRYLANALKSKRAGKMPSSSADIFDWIDAHARSLGLPLLKRPPDFAFSENQRSFRPKWANWRSQVIALAEAPTPDPSPLQKRIDWVADACSLTTAQRFILGLHVRLSIRPEALALAAAVAEELSYKSMGDPFDATQLRHLVGDKVAARELSDEGLLVRLGLVDNRDELRLSETVGRIVAQRTLSPRKLRELLLGKRVPASLGWEDFAHLGELRDLAARLISASQGADGGACGPNLLFYGPPGTGKSEFAKTLGDRVGMSVRFVGEADEKNAEPNRRERVAALMMANALGAATGGVLAVIDEADDLFAGVDEDDASTRHGSKVFMNRLVERSRTPTIWITNNLSQLGPAVVRRMNLVLRFSNPGLPVRRKMVERIAERVAFRLDGEATNKLARMPAAPALMENAIMASARIGGGSAEALTILESSLSALGVRKAIAAPAPIAFDPTLSAADIDLAALSDQIVRSPSRALSFCLSGPPGTGKSAYARHLAERLDMEVLEKRYSDLSSIYLGESEKAIAAAFEEAADLRAFLIFDEADSLLRDRSAARHSWEITQVNEMLTWMERHPYPFACTTNALDALDPATARRFLFKVRFLAMDSRQIAAAFHRAFDSEAPRCILKLEGLTPGDFAVVARKSEVFCERDPERLALWLEDEVRAKPNFKRQKIGF